MQGILPQLYQYIPKESYPLCYSLKVEDSVSLMFNKIAVFGQHRNVLGEKLKKEV
jgi:hypothetical protein